MSPDSSEAKNAALSNDGVSQRLMKNVMFEFKRTTEVGVKSGRDPGSNPGRGAFLNSFKKN